MPMSKPLSTDRPGRVISEFGRMRTDLDDQQRSIKDINRTLAHISARLDSLEDKYTNRMYLGALSQYGGELRSRIERDAQATAALMEEAFSVELRRQSDAHAARMRAPAVEASGRARAGMAELVSRLERLEAAAASSSALFATTPFLNRELIVRPGSAGPGSEPGSDINSGVRGATGPGLSSCDDQSEAGSDESDASYWKAESVGSDGLGPATGDCFKCHQDGNKEWKRLGDLCTIERLTEQLEAERLRRGPAEGEEDR